MVLPVLSSLPYILLLHLVSSGLTFYIIFSYQVKGKDFQAGVWYTQSTSKQILECSPWRGTKMNKGAGSQYLWNALSVPDLLYSLLYPIFTLFLQI